jgi:hypothetical protein
VWFFPHGDAGGKATGNMPVWIGGRSEWHILRWRVVPANVFSINVEKPACATRLSTEDVSWILAS